MVATRDLASVETADARYMTRASYIERCEADSWTGVRPLKAKNVRNCVIRERSREQGSSGTDLLWAARV